MMLERLVITLFVVFAVSGYFTEPVNAQASKELTNSIGMKLVLIPKGTFTMGSPESEPGRLENEQQHEVTISKDYYIGAYEVTQVHYEKVMGANPSFYQGKNVKGDSSKLPVEMVSRDEAAEFCKRLSELPEEKKAGRDYRLPTEAEWEYACRAGTKTAFNFGASVDSLGDYAWFDGNTRAETHPIGEKRPNAWGVYDMHGNVWEWCSDWYGDYPQKALTDPAGPAKAADRVLRGGSWNFGAADCRSATRSKNSPSYSFLNIGFRVVMSSPEVSK